MGVSLLILLLAFAGPILRRLRSLHDMFLGAVFVAFMLLSGLGLIAEGGEAMGWW